MLKSAYTKTLEGKKSICIAGDWNFNLLEFSKHEETMKVYEPLMSNLLAPSFTISTRINWKVGTLMNNIFSNCINLNSVQEI